MDEEGELWRLEESFWLGGAQTFRSTMADGAIMVFPYPAGILQGDRITDGIGSAPRWRSVLMRDRTASIRGNVAVLAYRAEAERESEPLREMLCASTYIREEGGWRLMSHQQTPVDASTAAGSSDG